MTAERALRLRLDHGPGPGIGQQCGNHSTIELVAAAYGAVGAQQGRARERKIPDGVQNLVPDELVGKAHALRVEHAVIGDDEGIFQGCAKRVTGAPQRRDIAHEAERARASDLVTEGIGPAVEHQSLPPNERMLEFDLCLYPKTS